MTYIISFIYINTNEELDRVAFVTVKDIKVHEAHLAQREQHCNGAYLTCGHREFMFSYHFPVKNSISNISFKVLKSRILRH